MIFPWQNVIKFKKPFILFLNANRCAILWQVIYYIATVLVGEKRKPLSLHQSSNRFIASWSLNSIKLVDVPDIYIYIIGRSSKYKVDCTSDGIDEIASLIVIIFFIYYKQIWTVKLLYMLLKTFLTNWRCTW